MPKPMPILSSGFLPSLVRSLLSRNRPACSPTNASSMFCTSPRSVNQLGVSLERVMAPTYRQSPRLSSQIARLRTQRRSRERFMRRQFSSRIGVRASPTTLENMTTLSSTQNFEVDVPSSPPTGTAPSYSEFVVRVFLLTVVSPLRTMAAAASSRPRFQCRDRPCADNLLSPISKFFCNRPPHKALQKSRRQRETRPTPPAPRLIGPAPSRPSRRRALCRAGRARYNRLFEHAPGAVAETKGVSEGNVTGRTETAADAALRVGLVSLGCAKNLVDSEVMLGRLAERHELVGRTEDADVVVINTCAFIEDAKQESIDTILEMTERKQRGELRHVVVTGCLAQRYADELAAQLPEVDLFVGTTAEREIGALLSRLDAPAQRSRPRALPMAARESERRVHVIDPSLPYGAETSRLRLTPRHYAYLRVAEGCNHRCTFCAIPSFRGRFRSKPRAAILEEARELVADGARELLLIAEDTNQWGQDLGREDTLAALLADLDRIEGLRWIRLLYTYPAYFDDALIDAIAGLDKVVKYVDMPLQHIADPVLRAMRRPPRARTEALLERLRERIPGLVLRTTFICGFPGETERDHEELLAFVRRFRFERLGAFAYSEEDGTPAATMPGMLDPAERQRRRDELMAAQQEIAFARNEALVGHTFDAMIDRLEAPGVALGRSYGDAPEIDTTVRIHVGDARPQPGDVVRVQVRAARGYDLEAEVLP
ncbi:MAG: 30S ribosomal protein S12 methylthiotransferase RimO [Planctomycetota bacterium]|nr:MAG: 30S ribosomal protein S12 methylthiotransferase RimO [Planctomycetota bacterium]